MHKTFPTNGPVSLHVEIGAGQVEVEATETDKTEVYVEGRDADDVTVEQRGDQVVVIAPPSRAGFFNSNGELRVTVTVPSESNLSTRLGSADVEATGRFGAARIKTGSGEVRLGDLTGDSTVDTGSGDVEIDGATANLRVKTGSGDVVVGRVTRSVVVSTGSGSVEVGAAEDTASLKSGSGDLRVKEAHTDVSAVTASGDVVVGRIRRGAVRAKAATGDIYVGVPAGIPVWTDVSCVTGSVHSTLEGAGEPADGQDHIEIRATTVSGDVDLDQL